MFTGIIQAVGRIERLEARAGDVRVHVGTGELDLADTSAGDSIAVSGVCLTVVALAENGFCADVSNETVARTTLGQRKPGDPVNLEKALRVVDRLGGHLVSGHIDGVGKLFGATPDGRSTRWEIDVPPELARYIAGKGSVSVDGVSLTVNHVHGNRFDVNLIPHTLEHTSFHACRVGAGLNIEVDVVARYVERLLARDDGAIDMAFLQQHGFAQEKRCQGHLSSQRCNTCDDAPINKCP